MSNKLINDLSSLKLNEKYIKRALDIKYYDSKKRTELFNELKQCKKEIERIKFKINLERRIKNENNNTNSTENEKK